MSARRTKRTDGRYSVTVRLERSDGTIRRTYFYGRTQAEAKAKADAARERVSRGEPVRDATRTLSDWARPRQALGHHAVLLHMEKLGRAASTRRSAYAAMRSTFDDAVIDGLLAASPVLRVKRPRATHHEATSLTPKQVTQLLQGTRDLRYEKVLRLILGTGLRRGESARTLLGRRSP